MGVKSEVEEVKTGSGVGRVMEFDFYCDFDDDCDEDDLN